ncbi:MAG: VOC family protein [Gammaproteobacteria bacterium]|nr:VOC family protein [Gammaproteobacteria bacterium]
MPNIHAILHSSVLTEDLDRALAFYCGVLQLEEDTARPDLGYPGAWLWVGSQQIHLLRLPNPDPIDNRPAHGGRDRHVALAVTSLTELQQRLDQAGTAYTLSKSGRRALFCRDPDGNALEFIE